MNSRIWTIIALLTVTVASAKKALPSAKRKIAYSDGLYYRCAVYRILPKNRMKVFYESRQLATPVGDQRSTQLQFAQNKIDFLVKLDTEGKFEVFGRRPEETAWKSLVAVSNGASALEEVKPFSLDFQLAEGATALQSRFRLRCH